MTDAPAPEELGPMLTTLEVAEMLNVHTNTVLRLGDRGDLKFYRVSRRGDRRHRWADVREFLVADGRYLPKEKVG